MEEREISQNETASKSLDGVVLEEICEDEHMEEAESAKELDEAWKEQACVNQLLEAIQQVERSVTGLQQCFDAKIVTDQHKNQLFDTMHSELVEYRNGSAEKLVNSIAVDIIQVVDFVLKTHEVFLNRERTEENYEKLLKNCTGIAEELQDILYRQGIEPYRNAGDEVDVRRQKIIGTVPTQDRQQNNHICKRLGEGYEKDGKIIRPERIMIYKYETDEKKTNHKNQ